MKTQSLKVITCAIGFASILAVSNKAHSAVIIGAEQFNAGDVLPSPIVAVSGDLLETSVSSVTGENANAGVRNGTTGTALEQSAANPVTQWQESETTYTLDTSVNTAGYDISRISLFSGWDSGRASQSYTIEYSLVGSTSFATLGTVSDLTTETGSMVSTTYDTTGANILTGVDQLRFIQNDTDVAPGVTAGSGTVFREFDVIGTAAAAVPEPSTYALIGCGLACLLLNLRRRKIS